MKNYLKILSSVDELKVRVLCKRCGKKDIRSRESVEDKFWCRGCGQQTEVDLKKLNKRLIRKFKGRIKALSQIFNKDRIAQDSSSGYIRFTCTCGNAFTSSPDRVLNTLHGCSHCSRRVVQENRRQNSKNEYLSLLQGKGCTLLPIEEYKTARIPIKHRCTSCKHTRLIAPTHLLKLAKCINCAPRNKSRSVTIDKKTFNVFGYEDIALIILTKRFRASEIESYQSGNVPQVKYGKGKRHYPDLFIPRKNLLIEVKGPATFGMKKFPSNSSNAERFYACCNKAKAAVEQGFKYKLMLILQSGVEFKLPRDWYDWSFRDMHRFYTSKV